MQYTQPNDWEKLLLLINASIQAYRAFDHDPAPAEAPPGYEIVATWTGVDSVFTEDRTVEVYGIAFRSVDAPYRYVFSFRGTDSALDLIDDLGAEMKPFPPFDGGGVIPADVMIESGFADVYTETDGLTPSMQQQVFALLDSCVASPGFPLHELWITGHSLGAALSELFSLDVAVSRPKISASNINFASPRAGNAAFVAFYGQQAAEQDPSSRTLRVQNVFDRVPCVPPEDLGYQHVNDAFLIAFYKHGTLPVDFDFLIHNHAALNYQAVLQCAATSPGQTCIQSALPVPGETYTVTSEKANPDDVCRLF